MISNNRQGRPFFFQLALLSACILSVCHALNDATKADMKRARELAKPWLMRNIEINETKLPVSPATVITIFVVLVNLFNIFFVKKWAEASHILIKDSSNNTKKMMEAMKKDIGDDFKRFGDYAAKYSQCPSKSRKGDLGRFKSGDMAPPFDKVVFDPKSLSETTLGPVQTQFGWHLIYIKGRSKL